MLHLNSETVLHWQNTIQFANIFIFGPAFLLMPFIYIFVGRKFDKKFKHRTIGFMEQGPLGFMWRMNIYVAGILHPKRVYKNKLSYMSLLYNGYDFRKNSNKFQIVLCYVYIISFFTGAFFQVTAISLKFIAQHLL